MEDPANEIDKVVKLIATAATPEIQKATIERFFASDAGLQHPLCTVTPGPGSRSRILGVYQWYRVMSPNIDLEVESFTYNPDEGRVYLNVTQTFHLFLSCLSPSPASLLVRVTLRRDPADGLYYIIQQEDFYQPEDILHLILPPLVGPLSLVKRITGPLCGMYAAVFQCFGFWRPDPAGLPGPSRESGPSLGFGGGGNKGKEKTVNGKLE